VAYGYADRTMQFDEKFVLLLAAADGTQDVLQQQAKMFLAYFPPRFFQEGQVYVRSALADFGQEESSVLCSGLPSKKAPI
jgi:hypothetical protein